jgi:hypothetical protein
MSSDTSKLGGFAITSLRAYWAYDRACTDLGTAIQAVTKRPATGDQLGAIRAAARNVIAKGDDYRAFLVVAMDDVFGEDSTSEEQILEELGQLRSELAKASVYDTDEFELLNTEMATSRAGTS